MSAREHPGEGGGPDGSALSPEGPEEAEAAVAAEPAPEPPIHEELGWWLLRAPLPGAVHALRRSAGPLFTAAAAPLLPLALLGLLLPALPVRFAYAGGQLVFFPGPDGADLPPPLPAVSLALLPPTLYAAAVSWTASLLVAAGVLSGGPVDARAALRRALRPWPALASLAAVAAVLACAAAAGSGLLHGAERLPPEYAYLTPVAQGAAAIAVAAVSSAAVPAGYAGVSALLERTGYLTALRRVRPLLRRRWGRALGLPLLLLAASAGVQAGIGYALDRAPIPSLLSAAAGPPVQLLAAAGSWMLLACLCAVAVLHEHVRYSRSLPVIRTLDIRAVRDGLPRGGGRPPLLLRPVPLLALLTAAATALPALVWAVPSTAPSYGVLPLAELEPAQDAEVRTASGESVLLQAEGRFPDRVWCAPECRVLSEESDGEENREGPDSAVYAGDAETGLTRAYWEDGVLRAGEACLSGPGCSDRAVPLREVLTEEGGSQDEINDAAVFGRPRYRAVAAAALDGTRYIASLAPTPGWGGQELRLHRCPTADCADSETSRLGGLPIFALHAGPVRHAPVDVAAHPDGSVAVSVHDRSTGAITVFTCPGGDCSEPVRNVVAEPRYPTDEHGGRKRPVTGSRIEIRPDGRPVLAYRAPEDGSVRLVDCADGACSASEERTLTGPGWRRPLAGLALDSAGRPQLAATTGDGTELTYLACADAGCTEVRKVDVAPVERRFTDVGLALDAADRPRLLVDPDSPPKSLREEEDLPEEYLPRVLACDRPHCGAPVSG
ncbi:hypothetical protein J0910_06265 [Nocardiopsis sp. CNT-189]|uniref:hypothetical protein n=1 Tax=Nocardiopsis oceanisediminis TaxID=2816862 RepID=UPI003B2FC260